MKSMPPIWSLRGPRVAPLWGVGIFVFAMAVAASSPTAHADEANFNPIESAGEALREGANLPWYDAAKDEAKLLPLSEKPKPPQPPNVAGTKIEEREPETPETTTGSSAFGGLFQLLGWGAIAILIAIILTFLFQAVLRGAGLSRSELDDVSQETHIDRVENLPVQVKRSQTDLLGEARRQYQAGNYNEAIVYLYSFQLVQLDKHQLIRLLKGKTNRQYLWELGARRELAEIVEQTMIAFEDVFFGERNLTRAQFEHCWRRVDEFQQHLEPVTI